MTVYSKIKVLAMASNGIIFVFLAVHTADVIITLICPTIIVWRDERDVDKIISYWSCVITC